MLALDLALKRGPFYTEEGLVSLFTAVAWVTSAGLVAAVLLVFGNRRTISAGAQVQKKGANYGGNGHYQAAKVCASPARTHTIAWMHAHRDECGVGVFVLGAGHASFAYVAGLLNSC